MGWMDALMHEWMQGLMIGRMDERMDVMIHVDGCYDGWML